jgi:hypothetical protein
VTTRGSKTAWRTSDRVISRGQGGCQEPHPVKLCFETSCGVSCIEDAESVTVMMGGWTQTR